jgi:hypothetical protein
MDRINKKENKLFLDLDHINNIMEIKNMILLLKIIQNIIQDFHKKFMKEEFNKDNKNKCKINLYNNIHKKMRINKNKLNKINKNKNLDQDKKNKKRKENNKDRYLHQYQYNKNSVNKNIEMILNKKDIENRKIKRNKKRKSRKNKRNKNIKDHKVLTLNIEVKILVIKGIDKDQEVRVKIKRVKRNIINDNYLNYIT